MTRNRKPGPGEVIASAVATSVANILLLGLVVMVFVPMLGVVLGLPVPHPGYWISTGFAVLTKALLAEAGKAWRPHTK